MSLFPLIRVHSCSFVVRIVYMERQDERKTPDDRLKMTELERIRHSCAHVLATAILRLWPDAQFAAGPPVENGFYYDVELSHRISPDEYFKMLEEAKRRDHRKIGAEMGLFVLDAEYVGPGLPLWLPKGTVLVEELEKLAKETEFAAGYVRVKTPHLAKEKMYKTSGHLPYYAESMFPAMELHEETLGQGLEQMMKEADDAAANVIYEEARRHLPNLDSFQENDSTAFIAWWR